MSLLNRFTGVKDFPSRVRERNAALRQLDLLAEDEQGEPDKAAITWEESRLLQNLSDRLGRAGFITGGERLKAQRASYAVILLCTLCGFWWFLPKGIIPAIFGGAGGAYLGLLFWLAFLGSRAKRREQELLFELPLALESVILLVEAGFGVLPALEQVVEKRTAEGASGPAFEALRLVYSLSSHGVPFQTALEMVAEAVDLAPLRHVLLHLEISGAEGGALAPSLRALADHSHTEWKVSVETRVNRLENQVVFPVFLAVIGLMVLTAAAPLVPVLDFMESIEKPPAPKTAVAPGGR